MLLERGALVLRLEHWIEGGEVGHVPSLSNRPRRADLGSGPLPDLASRASLPDWSSIEDAASEAEALRVPLDVLSDRRESRLAEGRRDEGRRVAFARAR